MRDSSRRTLRGPEGEEGGQSDSYSTSTDSHTVTSASTSQETIETEAATVTATASPSVRKSSVSTVEQEREAAEPLPVHQSGGLSLHCRAGERGCRAHQPGGLSLHCRRRERGCRGQVFLPLSRSRREGDLTAEFRCSFHCRGTGRGVTRTH